MATRATDPALLIYTSGTTGPPKGALMPYQCLLGNLPGFVHSHDGYPREGDLILKRARPLWTVNAYAIEQHAFEFVAGYIGQRTGDRDRHALGVELEYGVLRNAEIGIGVPFVFAPGAGEDAAFGGIGAAVLYNLNSETPRLPALALRAGVELPTGAFGPEQALGRIGAALTRSFGRTRWHLNGAWDGGPVAEAPRWHASLALDRTLLFSSTLLGAEVVVVRDDAGVNTILTFDLIIKLSNRFFIRPKV